MDQIHWMNVETDIAEDVLGEVVTVLIRRGHARTAALVAGVEAIRFQWPADDIPASPACVQLFCDDFQAEVFDQGFEGELASALKPLLERRGIRVGSIVMITTPPLPPLDDRL